MSDRKTADRKKELLTAFRRGERRALSRMLTMVANRSEGINGMLDDLFSLTGQAWRIGITGPPGAGKSTLVNQLVGLYRKQDLSIGVVAFDPTSPFTGGALLGDRVRMEMISQDPGVFIRSLATRGHLGGLAIGVDESCDLMDAFGKQRVLIETVGVGQSELEVADSADTTIVVLVPQSGDAIQAMKAGLMEIADIFVLNKCDREDAKRAYQELISILNLKEPQEGWRPPVIRTIAEKGDGVDELMATIDRHREHLVTTDRLAERRSKRYKAKIRQLVEDDLHQRLWRTERKRESGKGFEGGRSPYSLAKRLIDDFYEEIRDDES
ncbi:MAG: methylmalonyl Co-A mutase-associated GTPase MeaB [bacterium]